MGSLLPSSPSGNPNPPPSPLSEHHNPPPSPPSPHLQPLPPSVDWSFDQSLGSIETPIATHLSPIPTYSWEETDSMSTVVPETQLSVNPSMSPLPPLSPSVDWSFDSTLESIETTSAADLSPISTVVPETPPAEGVDGYTEEEKHIIRFLAIQCPCVLLLL